MFWGLFWGTVGIGSLLWMAASEAEADKERRTIYIKHR